MSYTVIREGHRWCLGLCGRWLSVEMFYRNGNGCCNTECWQCHRVRCRGRYRTKYQQKGFRLREQQRKRAEYWANREKKLAQRRAYYVRKKAREAA
jgi:hypothetical protein